MLTGLAGYDEVGLHEISSAGLRASTAQIMVASDKKLGTAKDVMLN